MTVEEKKVELIELFYDLIFVYAISNLTALISKPVNGIIPFNNLFAYFITSFVILQAWLYFTNYVNRYGKWELHEYILAIVNMIAVIFMANTISTQWSEMFVPFNVSMLVMLLTVVTLYSIRAYQEKSLKGAAGNSISILLIVCFVYLIAIIAIFLNFNNVIITLIDAVAVITGAFLPFFLKGEFDKSIINFPHLVERFELLTIITFGEAVVGMTHFFDVYNLSLLPILVFIIIITMFGSYVIQIHNLVNHHRVERSLRLMFSHYFIIISINLMTVAIELLHNSEVSVLLESMLMIVSLVVFYTSLLANKKYYHDDVELNKNDIIKIILLIVIGSLVMFAFNILIGALIITVGCFIVLAKKDKLRA